MSDRSSGTKALLALVVVLVAVVAIVRTTLFVRLAHEPAEAIPTSSFCTSFWRRIDHDVAQVRRGIEGHPRKGDLDIDGLEVTSALWWSDGIIEGGPPQLRDEARVVAQGFQRALSSRQEAPLDEPRFRAAVRRLATDGSAGCAHHFPGVRREDPPPGGS
jgi:hypothetical protein